MPKKIKKTPEEIKEEELKQQELENLKAQKIHYHNLYTKTLTRLEAAEETIRDLQDNEKKLKKLARATVSSSAAMLRILSGEPEAESPEAQMEEIYNLRTGLVKKVPPQPRRGMEGEEEGPD